MSQRSDAQGHERELPETLLEAIEQTPRDEFLPTTIASPVLRGVHHPIARNRSVPSDRVLAEFLAGLALEEPGHVLVVGAACGYVCAILDQLGHRVSVLDPDRDILDATRSRCEEAGIELQQAELGRAGSGWPNDTIFDGIVVLTSQPEAPDALLASVDENGALVFAEGRALGDHDLKALYRQSDQNLVDVRARVRLIDRLGDVLVALKTLRREQVESAAEHASEHDQRIGESALQLFPISDAAIYDALARQHGIKRSGVMSFIPTVDVDLVESLDTKLYDSEHVLPVRLEDDSLVVATDRPTGSFAELAEMLDARAVDPYLFSPTNFERLMRLLELGGTTFAAGQGQPKQPVDAESLGVDEQDARAVRIFETLLLDAVGERASDIHIERNPDEIRIRYRVDGELIPVDHIELSPGSVDHIINAIKVRAEMDISEPRLPHDGRMQRDIGGRRYDLRIHTQPTFHGEGLAIRLLPQEVQQLSIDELGFAKSVVQTYKRVLQDPGGLVLVVGPTGSGKTTTLYAGLEELASDVGRKVVSVEDPVEYDIENIQQTQIREQAGLTFDGAVRSLVRHDPDVILLGEIRDPETAVEAIRASQTGHLVLSTVHANDTTDTLQRLFDLGVEPNSVASELRAIFAQRLAQRICEGCRVPADPPEDLLAELFPEGVPENMRFFKGKGCAHCDGRGTYGRIAVAECLPSNPRIRKAISRELQVDELREIATGEGLTTLRESALAHVHRGLIALDQLPKILASTHRIQHYAENNGQTSE